MCPFEPAPPQFAPQAVVQDQQLERGRQAVGVAWIDLQPGVADYLRQRRRLGYNDRRATGHRLERR